MLVVTQLGSVKSAISFALIFVAVYLCTAVAVFLSLSLGFQFDKRRSVQSLQ